MNTVKPLPVFASTSRQSKGAFCERLVQQRLERAGYDVWSTSLQTPFAQVDLLVLNPNRQCLALIEVKYARLGLSAADLVSQAQCRRLRRAHLWLVAQYPHLQVRSVLAVVNASQRVTWYPDFLC